ncbi:MAG TPA: LEA type 2 family protein [Lysobacter sp.]|nr:LEA type 2 family protein [Lysobacter sp.]
MTGKRWMRWAGWALCALLLAACASGPARRVSEPTARIQQLTVLANGNWSTELRIENFSSIPMRFDSVQFALAVDGQDAGTLAAQPALTIGPESADVITMTLSPPVAAKLAVADALARKRGLDYTLEGTVAATPDEQRQREYKLKRSSTLSPTPGLPGVLR